MHRADCDDYKKNVDVYMEDGDVLDLDGEEIKIVSTPGHTKGSVCFVSRKEQGSLYGRYRIHVDLGRTDLKGGSPADMERSIRNIVDKWPNDYSEIARGHGDECTMKTVRRINTEFLHITGQEVTEK